MSLKDPGWYKNPEFTGLGANEIARRLASNEGVIGPRIVIALDPPEFEQNPKFVKVIMDDTKLITQMLQFYFAAQGLRNVSIEWENCHLVKKD